LTQTGLCQAPRHTDTAALHRHFLDMLPRIERHALIYFRHVPCRQRRDDAVAEALALSWRWYLRLVERGKDMSTFVSTLATYAAKAVNCGRRLCGQEKAKDVLSPLAQRRHSFVVETLSGCVQVPHDKLYGEVGGQRQIDSFEERLRDNTRTPPDEQAAFRIDFPAWLRRLSQRNRRLARDMADGYRTKELARKYGTSQARISQLRREFMEDWRKFTGELN
jgi:hypothetical protein